MHKFTRHLVSLISLVALMAATVLPAFAQSSEEYTGTMDDVTPDRRIPITLEAGQTVTATAETTGGNLDPYLLLLDPAGATAAENDDIAFGNLNSQIVYTVASPGTYTLILTNIRGTGGTYRLVVEVDNAVPQVEAQTATEGEVFTGFMSDDVSDDVYPVFVAAGEGIVATAEATSGDLDTVVLIRNPAGETVALNDDRALDDLNSQAVYVAEESATYEVIVSNFPNSSGEYRLEIAIVSAAEAEAISRVSLSGEVLTLDTPNFRIHYTLEGVDAVTVPYVEAVAQTMEEVYTVQIEQFGWPPPPNDRMRGGDSRYDIYLTNLIDEYEGGDLGFAAPEFPPGDNPATATVETRAVPSYVVLDNDYILGAPGEEDVTRLMRATAAHEFHHAIQFGYDQAEPFNWYYEATSSWMETVTLPGYEDATGYVMDVFNYPEICFGAQGDADPTGGLLMYGHWLYIQTLVDRYGDAVVQALWQNIAALDGWEPLEATLAPYDTIIPDSVARYHLQNLVRDYALTPAFEQATVWEENRITSTGDWAPNGQGIQELAANYFTLTPGAYNLSVTDSSGELTLYAVGITGDTADVFTLGRGGTVDLSAYENAHVMVFAPYYDDELTACTYETYAVNVADPLSTPVPIAFSLNAAQYRPIGQ
ncbi:MAG: MXAN_6640 family putative metalloprotease [Chloroflexota bacterium]